MARAPQDHRRPAGARTAPAGPIELGGADEEARIDVFSAGGTMYGMPEEVPAEIALEALERFDTDSASAEVWILRELLGEEGYQALKSTATVRQLGAVLKVVSDHVFGQLEDAQGN